MYTNTLTTHYSFNIPTSETKQIAFIHAKSHRNLRFEFNILEIFTHTHKHTQKEKQNIERGKE